MRNGTITGENIVQFIKNEFEKVENYNPEITDLSKLSEEQKKTLQEQKDTVKKLRKNLFDSISVLVRQKASNNAERNVQAKLAKAHAERKRQVKGPSRINVMKRMNNAAFNELKRLHNQEIATMTKEMEELKSEMGKMKTEKGQQQTEMDRITSERNKLQAANTELKTENDELKAQNTALQEKLANVKKQIRSGIEKLQGEFNVKQETINQLKTLLESSVQKIDETKIERSNVIGALLSSQEEKIKILKLIKTEFEKVSGAIDKDLQTEQDQKIKYLLESLKNSIVGFNNSIENIISPNVVESNFNTSFSSE